MTEQNHKPTDTGKTAGVMLREARVAQGLHIAVMAASIKVAQRKLESLEDEVLGNLSGEERVRLHELLTKALDGQEE